MQATCELDETSTAGQDETRSDAPLTVERFAVLAGVSFGTVYRWIAQGRVPKVRIGRCGVGVPRSALESLKSSHGFGKVRAVADETANP